uniref:Uncharacterized protein n=1 Tax=Parascaris equorum TaxID=6256 RepID=A0A914R107_PAREQ
MNGEPLICRTYQYSDPDRQLALPSPHYKHVIVSGAIEHSLLFHMSLRFLLYYISFGTKLNMKINMCEACCYCVYWGCGLRRACSSYEEALHSASTDFLSSAIVRSSGFIV